MALLCQEEKEKSPFLSDLCNRQPRQPLCVQAWLFISHVFIINRSFKEGELFFSQVLVRNNPQKHSGYPLLFVLTVFFFVWGGGLEVFHIFVCVAA